MILSLNNIPNNGKDWEALCIQCYQLKYKGEHFTPIPAAYLGDAGIEGFTSTGVVLQCYCPEGQYSDDELYEHQRDKMTIDLGKLLNPKYAQKYAALGVPIISEWHYMIPAYYDSRIIQHAATKQRDIRNAINIDPDTYAYLSPDFSIYIKTFDSLKILIVQLLRGDLLDSKLSIQENSLPEITWEDCDSIKIESIRRKIKAVKPISSPEQIEKTVSTFAEAYLAGLAVVERLRVEYPQFYEELYQLQQTYAKIVDMKSAMASDPKLNSQHFNEILTEFGGKLDEQFGYFSTTLRTELQKDLVSGWLADCSLEFA